MKFTVKKNDADHDFAVEAIDNVLWNSTAIPPEIDASSL
jgi:hypothetical protein